MSKVIAKLDMLGRTIYRSSASQWVEKNKDRYSNREALATACAKAMPCTLKHALKTVVKVLKASKRPVMSMRKAKKAPPGLEGFRKLYSKTDRDLEKIRAAVGDVLKKRGHIPDAELRQILDIDMGAWANYRRDFENLLVEVRDEYGRRQTVWCHPDIVEQARVLARR